MVSLAFDRAGSDDSRNAAGASLLGRLSATGRHGKRILRPGGCKDWITRNESGSRLIVSARRPVLSPAQAEGEENDKPRHSYLTCHSCLRASRDRTHLVAFNEGNRILAAGGLMAKGKMTMPRPQQWTEAEVNRLRMFAKRKVGSDKIAKSLGRYVGSVKIKARELNLILSRRLKAKGK